MTQNFDLHVHTNFCDGKNGPEEVVRAAISLGLKTLGFSAHSYTFFDESYCIAKDRVEEYRRTIDALSKKYASDIDILCGIEQDFYSRESTASWDYVIGSVHYILVKDEYIPVDESAEILKKAAEKYFEGDFYALAEAYFETVSRVPELTRVDVIGHFDLISKFNDRERLFDETEKRYFLAAEKCLKKLALSGLPLEINTGAISRGYKSVPYPAPRFWREATSLGIPFLLSSDSHSADTLAFEFDIWERKAEKAGLKLLRELPVKALLSKERI